MEFVCACGRSFESRRPLGCHKRYCAAASQDRSPDIVCRSCGKSFSEERKLGDHTKNVCGRASECQFWGRTFETRSGVRQHERKAHFQIGPHLGRLAVHLGWTIDMVKYRRRLTQYKALLDDKQNAAATILGDKPPPLLASPGLTPLAAAPTPSPSGPCPSAPGLLPACPPCS
jgi:hypothetical protein